MIANLYEMIVSEPVLSVDAESEIIRMTWKRENGHGPYKIEKLLDEGRFPDASI